MNSLTSWDFLKRKNIRKETTHKTTNICDECKRYSCLTNVLKITLKQQIICTILASIKFIIYKTLRPTLHSKSHHLLRNLYIFLINKLMTVSLLLAKYSQALYFHQAHQILHFSSPPLDKDSIHFNSFTTPFTCIQRAHFRIVFCFPLRLWR